ncbi:hypothetical protein LMG33818_000067 [Halomonadaceae bacterium LMG 33818]|uniref:hypothetical protein n=1 Tax=Cernens ardua TaxID=3402176 RepID=UPI003EDC8060
MNHPHPSIIDIKDPVWADEDQSIINLKIQWAHSNGEYWPFTAHPQDSEKHGPLIFERAKNGEYGEVNPFDHDAHDVMLNRKTSIQRLRDIETELSPLRDEALAGIITDDDQRRLRELVSEAKKLRASL